MKHRITEKFSLQRTPSRKNSKSELSHLFWLILSAQNCATKYSIKVWWIGRGSLMVPVIMPSFINANTSFSSEVLEGSKNECWSTNRRESFFRFSIAPALKVSMKYSSSFFNFLAYMSILKLKKKLYRSIKFKLLGSASSNFDWKATANIQLWRGIPVNFFSLSRIDLASKKMRSLAIDFKFSSPCLRSLTLVSQNFVIKRIWSSLEKGFSVKANCPRRSSMVDWRWGRVVIHIWFTLVAASLSAKTKVIPWIASGISSKLSNRIETRPFLTASLKSLISCVP